VLGRRWRGRGGGGGAVCIGAGFVSVGIKRADTPVSVRGNRRHPHPPPHRRSIDSTRVIIARRAARRVYGREAWPGWGPELAVVEYVFGGDYFLSAEVLLLGLQEIGGRRGK
jgi:hypothetical protein